MKKMILLLFFCFFVALGTSAAAEDFSLPAYEVLSVLECSNGRAEVCLARDWIDANGDPRSDTVRVSMSDKHLAASIGDKFIISFDQIATE